MSLDILKHYFLRPQWNNELNTKLKESYYTHTITSRTSVVRSMQCSNRRQNKHNLCKFCEVPGGGSALLGMPDIEILGTISVKCNTIQP